MVAMEPRDRYVVDLELNVNMILLTDVADEREPQIVRLFPQSIADSAERTYGMFKLKHQIEFSWTIMSFCIINLSNCNCNTNVDS